jgi:hypothetical protein
MTSLVPSHRFDDQTIRTAYDHPHDALDRPYINNQYVGLPPNDRSRPIRSSYPRVTTPASLRYDTPGAANAACGRKQLAARDSAGQICELELWHLLQQRADWSSGELEQRLAR